MAQPPPIPRRHVRALTERIERMREAERTRIARELHDELGQLLTGIKLDFSATIRRLKELRPSAAHAVDPHLAGDLVDRLQSAIGQVDIAIAMVRRISTDLRPAALDHQDLGGAIENEVRRVGAQSGLRIRVVSCVGEGVSPELATAAFRIFQEALTNAVRHAHATAIYARATIWRGRLLLFLRDNGVGFAATASNEGHLGLLGMQERARSVGGTLHVRSRPGRGTLVSFVLPVG